jgi:Flp pilus assembly protein TadD
MSVHSELAPERTADGLGSLAALPPPETRHRRFSTRVERAAPDPRSSLWEGRMAPGSSPDPSVRWTVLERALRDKPGDPLLLGQACDAALAASRLEQAARHLAVAGGLGLEGAAWTRRSAQLAMARLDAPAALHALTRLRRQTGEQPQIAHDIALVLLRMGDASGCREQLAPWLQADAKLAEGALLAAMQCLWLRATARLGLLREAREWAAARQAEGRLSVAANGVASLVLLDLGDFTRAKAQAKAAFVLDPPPPEALVARATIVLLERDTAAATRWLTRALQQEAQDARTWATLAMAHLQGADLPTARAQFSHATRLAPACIPVWLGLGWSCVLLRDRAGALSAFRQALELDPGRAEGQACVALVLVLTGRSGEAEPHLARAAQIDADNAVVRYARLLAAGDAQDVAVFRSLAMRLLRPPGFHCAALAGGSAPAAA